jgi:hypothetical protein
MCDVLKKKLMNAAEKFQAQSAQPLHLKESELSSATL